MIKTILQIRNTAKHIIQKKLLIHKILTSLRNFQAKIIDLLIDRIKPVKTTFTGLKTGIYTTQLTRKMINKLDSRFLDSIIDHFLDIRHR